jgi:hypothetical protein
MTANGNQRQRRMADSPTAGVARVVDAVVLLGDRGGAAEPRRGAEQIDQLDGEAGEGAWQQQVLSVRGFKRVGRYSEYAIIINGVEGRTVIAPHCSIPWRISTGKKMNVCTEWCHMSHGGHIIVM